MPSSVPAAVALAVLVSLGAAMDASSPATLRPAGRDATALRPADRRAMAAWLHRLAESARRLHGQSQHAAGLAPPHVLVAATLPTLVDAPRFLARRGDVLAHHRLIDLPPPAATSL